MPEASPTYSKEYHEALVEIFDKLFNHLHPKIRSLIYDVNISYTDLIIIAGMDPQRAIALLEQQKRLEDENRRNLRSTSS